MFHNRHASHGIRTRVTATAAAASLLLCGAVIPVHADDVEDLKAQRQELINQQEALRDKLNYAAATLDEQEELKDGLEERIQLKMQEIEVNQQLIDKKDEEIAHMNYAIGEKQTEIAAKEAEINGRMQELRARLRAISKTGTLTSMMQMLLSSKDFSDYLIKSKAMERVSAYNQELLNSIEAEMEVINKAREELEKQKAVLNEERRPIAELHAELTLAKQELDVLYSEKNAAIDKLHQDIDRYKADIEYAKEQAAALQQQINESIGMGFGSNITYGGGTMVKPSNCEYISSLFGPRWGVNHNGIDFCGGGCYGTPIYAAADGVVSYAGWMGGYGYTVMIDHGTDSSGNNVTTLYAHGSAIYVSQGESVGAGQAIAAIGSSGDSTGPHLHFEVRLNGGAVDPIGYGYVSAGDYIINEYL